MIRGTTPTHTFELPFQVRNIDKLRLTYSQNGNIVFEKNEKQVTMAGAVIEYTLTQAESLSLSTKYPVEIQIKVKNISGSVVATKIMHFNATAVLNEEVL